jgi:hypothetical protein
VSRAYEEAYMRECIHEHLERAGRCVLEVLGLLVLADGTRLFSTDQHKL